MARRERGYAMIAAVAAVACFGYLALSAIKGGRSAVVSAGADLSHARLSADADAGVAMAIHELGLGDPRRRWSVVGPPHQLEYEGARLAITIEDENGKIPINFVRADQLRRLFEAAGADPRQIDGLVEAFIDLRGDPRPGATPVDAGFQAQRGPLTSLDELMLLPGMTPALFARIAPAVTVHASTLAFDPRTASPLALAVMSTSGVAAPGSVLAAASPIDLNGRTLSIRVDAADGRGGALRRTAIVEFTGAAARPYVMRGLE
jgi:general secretion pathway protein K